MERIMWKGHVLEGKLGEYIRRHDAIWPEMKAMFAEAGMRNYSIWSMGNELFGYYECEDAARAAQVQADSPVSARWREYMRGIVEMDVDPCTGERITLNQVFLYE